MSYKVIVDSCGEFTPEMKADGGFEHVAHRNSDRRHSVDR